GSPLRDHPPCILLHTRRKPRLSQNAAVNALEIHPVDERIRGEYEDPEVFLRLKNFESAFIETWRDVCLNEIRSEQFGTRGTHRMVECDDGPEGADRVGRERFPVCLGDIATDG